MVAGLAARTSTRTVGSSDRWLCRSMAMSRLGSIIFRRLPQMRSAASHKTTSASRTASESMRRPGTDGFDSIGPASLVKSRMACLRWHSATVAEAGDVVRHRLAGAVPVQHQKRPQRVGRLDPIRSLRDHSRLVIEPNHDSPANWNLCCPNSVPAGSIPAASPYLGQQT